MVFLYPLRRSDVETDKEKRSEKGHASTSVRRVVLEWGIEFNSRIELGFSEEIIYGRPTSASHCFSTIRSAFARALPNICSLLKTASSRRNGRLKKATGARFR